MYTHIHVYETDASAVHDRRGGGGHDKGQQRNNQVPGSYSWRLPQAGFSLIYFSIYMIDFVFYILSNACHSRRLPQGGFKSIFFAPRGMLYVEDRGRKPYTLCKMLYMQDRGRTLNPMGDRGREP